MTIEVHCTQNMVLMSTVYRVALFLLAAHVLKFAPPQETQTAARTPIG